MDSIPPLELVRSCPRCKGEALVEHDYEPGLLVDFCPGCGGIFFDRGELERIVGGRLEQNRTSVGLPPLDAQTLGCPVCPGSSLKAREVEGAPGVDLWDCFDCGGTWIDGKTLPILRRVAVRPSMEDATVAASRADEGELELGPLTPTSFAGAARSAEPARIPEYDGDGILAADRLDFDAPLARLLAVPVVFLFAAVFTATNIGRLLSLPFAIMIHELGHAVPAWLSGRAALPLPCGFTFWREDPSMFTALCLSFLLGVLGYRGWEEKRYFAVGVAGAGFFFQILLGLLMSTDGSRELVIAGGVTAEFVLSTFLVIAFYFPLPDRMRWDFWRYVVLVPAALTLMSATRLWWEVRLDPRRMPMGSMMSSSDGAGDLARLMNNYGWTVESTIHWYWGLSLPCSVAILGVYGYFASLAYRDLKRARVAPPPSSS